MKGVNEDVRLIARREMAAAISGAKRTETDVATRRESNAFSRRRARRLTPNDDDSAERRNFCEKRETSSVSKTRATSSSDSSASRDHI